MAEDDRDRLEANLELPKLFRRGKKAPPASVERAVEGPFEEPVAGRAAAAQPPPEVVPPPPAPAPAPAARAVEPPPVTPVAGGSPLFTDEAPAAKASTATLSPVRVDPDQRASRSLPRLGRPRVSLPSRPSLPALPALPPLPRPTGYSAVALTGLVVGLLMVGLTGGALRGCDAVRGTSTCGGQVGFPLLVAILAGLVVLGSLLLRRLEVPEPSSTSFLGVGLVAVVGLLFFVDALLSWWMLLVIPLVSVGTYLLSSWVTTAFVEPAND